MKSLLISLFFSINLFAQTNPPAVFTASQINSDLDFLRITVNHVHPNPYHDISAKNFELLIDSIRKSLPEKIGLDKTWIIFSKIMAAYNEGHSSISYPAEIQKQIQDGSIKIFPFMIREFNEKGLVVHYDLSAVSILKIGDVITSINGYPVKGLMKQLTSLFGGLENWKNLRVVSDFGGQLVIHNITGPYKLKYINQGITKELTIQPGTLQELQTRATEIRKKNPGSISTSQAAYSFQRIENIGYLNFRSMRDQTVFEKFLDSVFLDIQNKPIAGLIIDLRQNGGGNSQLGEKLIGYISDKPFKMGGGSMWKVSDEYKSFIKEQAKTNPVYAGGFFNLYLIKNSGETWNGIVSNTYRPGKNNLRYSGKVCMLTGPNTFSSANMLAK